MTNNEWIKAVDEHIRCTNKRLKKYKTKSQDKRNVWDMIAIYKESEKERDELFKQFRAVQEKGDR